VSYPIPHAWCWNIYPPVIKRGNWKSTSNGGASIEKSLINSLYFPARHVWFPEGTRVFPQEPTESPKWLGGEERSKLGALQNGGFQIQKEASVYIYIYWASIWKKCLDIFWNIQVYIVSIMAGFRSPKNKHFGIWIFSIGTTWTKDIQRLVTLGSEHIFWFWGFMMWFLRILIHSGLHY